MTQIRRLARVRFIREIPQIWTTPELRARKRREGGADQINILTAIGEEFSIIRL